MQYLLRVLWLLPVILLLILHSHGVPADERRAELPDAKQVADRSTAEDSQSQRDAIQAEKRRKVGLVGILVVLGFPPMGDVCVVVHRGGVCCVVWTV